MVETGRGKTLAVSWGPDPMIPSLTLQRPRKPIFSNRVCSQEERSRNGRGLDFGNR